MGSMTESLLDIDKQILVINKAICGHIDRFDASERGVLSQSILKHLRDFVEHIMLKIYANGQDIEDSWDNITKAVAYTKTRGDLRFLRRFHDFLQIVVSHYTIEEENSERLMLKYYEYLLRIRNFMTAKYSLNVLGNLSKFPIDTDTNLSDYYKGIAQCIVRRMPERSRHALRGDRYYIQKVKPFFVDQNIYYEVTFTPANGRASKFDRVIAFTQFEIPQNYAVTFSIVTDSIQMLGRDMQILIIVDWRTSVRPCEIDNFAWIMGASLDTQSRSIEYRGLMKYLTESGFNLVELLDLPDDSYGKARAGIATGAQITPFLDVLDRCRTGLKASRPGCNVLRYLLYHLNNRIIKDQWGDKNDRLSNLRLSNGCIPFDQMPINSSLPSHNPRLGDVFACIDTSTRQHEILARLVRNNAELRGELYTSVRDVVGFADIDSLAKAYNSRLWHGHASRKLVKRSGHIFISEYEEDTVLIVRRLMQLATDSVSNYANSVASWLRSGAYQIDSPEKEAALKRMFEASTVALVYGSAGTGKSTLINHVSHFFADKAKLYLAQTNPAVDNMKRRVDAAGCTFSTITKFLSQRHVTTEYDLLVIDECSTVSNRDMRLILGKASFRLLVLVGDVYQIEAIRFGNWFAAAREFVPETSVVELTTPYRTSNERLLELWRRVRTMDETILELLAKQGYSVSLDASVFDRSEADEIVLCLNYDGLYGINNINRLLQQSNPNPEVSWGIQLYKVDDPVLFNESERFSPLIYNNTKGRIAGVEVIDGGDRIQFDIELDKAINGLDARRYSLVLLGNSPRDNSIVRFTVDKHRSTDSDDDAGDSSLVPFQVAYAVSIHKAQGLEYSSVKIVISDEVDELITHNIFYTAITRAREKLRMYWTPEVEKKVLSQLKPKQSKKDVAILRGIIG